MSAAGLAWALLLGASCAAAQQGGAAAALRRLDVERGSARRAIEEQLQQRRQAMVHSETWTLSTDEERRQRLDALQAEFRDHERRLSEEYEARRKQIRRGYEPRLPSAPGPQAQGAQGHQ